MIDAILTAICTLFFVFLVQQVRENTALRSELRQAHREYTNAYYAVEYERERADKAALRAQWLASELGQPNEQERAA